MGVLPIDEQEWVDPEKNQGLFEGLPGPHVVEQHSPSDQPGVISKALSYRNTQTNEPIVSMVMVYNAHEETLYIDELMIDQSIVKKDHRLASAFVKRILYNTLDYAKGHLGAKHLTLGGMDSQQREEGSGLTNGIYVANRAGFKPPADQYFDAQKQLFDFLNHIASDGVKLITVHDIEDGRAQVRYGPRLAEETGITRPLGYDDLFEIPNDEIKHMIIQGDIVPAEDDAVLLPLVPPHKTSAQLKMDAKSLLETLEYEQSKSQTSDMFRLVKNTSLAEDIHRQLTCDMELDLTNDNALKATKSYLKGNMQEREAVKQAAMEAQGAGL